MKLIFALGNPESRYAGTRHNVGFAVADAWAAAHDGSWKQSAKHKAIVAELRIDDDKIIVAKPTTYYNLVGESYQSLVNFYDIGPADVLVVHDDLALDYGTIRTRIGGSGGGSNGIRSLNAHGGDETVRLRTGVRNDLADRIDNADFVLSKFTKSESEQLPELLDRATKLVDDFIDGELQLSTYQ